MSKRFFVQPELTDSGKYRVLQEDLETRERFGVKDFDTQEEADRTAEDMQRAVDHALSENPTEKLPEMPVSSSTPENRFKDTL